MNLFENLQMMKEADDLKNVNFRQLTVREFAELIDEDPYVISDLMGDCRTCSYVDKPYEAIVGKVKKSKIPEDKKEVVIRFIYENLFNRVLGDVRYK